MAKKKGAATKTRKSVKKVFKKGIRVFKPTNKKKPMLKRRASGHTNYVKRLALIKSGEHRFVVRRSNNNMLVQCIRYETNGDITVASASSVNLVKLGWKGHNGNLSAAYLAGRLCAKQTIKKGVKSGILDLGLFTPVHGNAGFSALKGLVDGGIKIPHSKDCFPKEASYTGKRVAEYAAKLSANKDVYARQFSGYKKRGLKPEELNKNFETVLTAIGGA